VDIQLSTRIVLQLQEIARETEREISALLTEAIEEYVERRTNESQFRETVRQTISDHKWLLDELDQR
jgi:predicted transcriptional regulator